MAVVTGCHKTGRNNGLEVLCLYKMNGTKDELLKIKIIVLEYIQ